MMNRRTFLWSALAGASVRSVLNALLSSVSGARVASPFAGLSTRQAGMLEEANLTRATSEIDALIADGPFKPDWD